MTIFIGIIFLLIGLRLLYWLFIFSKLALYKETYAINREEGVSVVICVKNNKIQLQKLIEKLLKQNHSNYEIVIVDDFSTDGLKEYIDSINNSKVIYCKAIEDVPGKKAALSQGINIASKEWILVTDSDCMPTSLDWIALMSGQAIESNKEIILGYAPLKGSNFIGQLSMYETAFIGMQYLSYALWQNPYMGVGRNMLFSKKLFLQSNAYEGNFHLPSGDDDFFVQKAATYDNTGICTNINAQCMSESPTSFSKYLSQKMRHTSTSKHYKNKHQFLLGIFAFLHLAIYFMFLIGLFFGFINLKIMLSTWLSMMAFIFIIQYVCFSKMNEARIILNLFISDILLAILYTFVAVKSFFNKNQKWN